jgi:hypothetical protein
MTDTRRAVYLDRELERRNQRLNWRPGGLVLQDQRLERHGKTVVAHWSDVPGVPVFPTMADFLAWLRANR